MTEETEDIGAEADSTPNREYTEELATAINILAGEYNRAAIVQIRGLTFMRENTAGNIWSLFDEDDQIVDAIDADEFRSAKELLQYVDRTLNDETTRWSRR